VIYPGGATNTFAYNGFGQRVGKSDSLGTRTYLYDGWDVLSDAAAFYTWVVDGLASERRSGVSRWSHADGLWSTRKLTNASQSVTDTFGTDGFGLVTSRTGTTPTPFRFVGGLGYQADPDSGVYLLGHRYYDPSIGRFVTRDPVRDGINWYAYGGNNPVNVIDPQGLEQEEKKPLYQQVMEAVGQAVMNLVDKAVHLVIPRVNLAKAIIPKGIGEFDPAYQQEFYRAAGEADYLINDRLVPIVAMGVMQGVAGSFGDLTPEEIGQIQELTNKAGRPIYVGGSAARGVRRGIGTDWPIGKGPGTRSDIDYIIPPSSAAYWAPYRNQLPGMDPHGPIFGVPNPYVGPVIRFEPH